MKTVVLYVYDVPDEVSATEIAGGVNQSLPEGMHASPYPPKERA